MTTPPTSKRLELAREAAIFQIKLLADGFRDAILIPISIIAALLGLLRGGPDADREYRQVIKWGLRSERWINLFGHQKPLGRPHPAASIDTLLGRVESTVVEQYQKGKASPEVRAAVEEVVRAVRREAQTEEKPASGPDQ